LTDKFRKSIGYVGFAYSAFDILEYPVKIPPRIEAKSRINKFEDFYQLELALATSSKHRIRCTTRTV